MKRRLGLGAITASMVACCAPCAAHADLARIAFTGRDGIYTIRADGSERTRIAGPLASYPAWAPDDRRIAFTRVLRHNRAQIWTMRPDGSDPHPLTRASRRNVQELTPAWSADGRSVAFARERVRRDSVETSLVVIGADGRHERTLAKVSSRQFASIGGAAWAPDGRRLLYTRVQLGRDAYFQPSLWIVNADGSGSHLLASDAGEGSWAPDGSRIAAVSTRDRNGQNCGEDECSWDGEIYVMNGDGSGQTRLTNSKADDESPVWSADGGRIAFASTRNYPDERISNFEIYSMKPDGSCLTWLTNGSTGSETPAWEPGAALSSDPGGCSPTARPPLVDTKVPKPSLPHGATSYWLGRITPDGLLLTDAGQGFYAYDDCGNFDPAACPPMVDIDNTWICSRDALVLDGFNAAGLRVVRGGLLYKSPDDVEGVLYTGTTKVDLQTSLIAAERIADGLRPANSSQALPGDLPPPRLPDFVWRKLERVTSAYARLHDVARVAHELRLHVVEVQSRLAVVDKLRSLGVTGRVPCPPHSWQRTP